jgi:hypothetical protein
LHLFDVADDGAFTPKISYQADEIIVDAAIYEDTACMVSNNSLLIVKLGAKPARKGAIKLAGDSTDVRATENNCFISDRRGGLLVVNINDPEKPALAAKVRTPGEGKALGLRTDLTFFADGSGGLIVFDTRNAGQPRWLGSHNKLGDISRVLVHGEKAVVVDDRMRLVSLNVSNPELPITDSFYKTQALVNDIAMAWPYVYAATNDGVERVAFNYSADVQISNEGINHGGSRRAFIRGDIAYVADWFSGLHIYDISLPYLPRHLGNFHTPGSAKGVVVRGNYAFVGDDDHGLQIVDISDPRKPTKVSEVLSTGLAYTMKMNAAGDRIYLADHRGGFHIIDVADVRKPRIIGSYDTPSKSWAIDVKGDRAFVADDASGLLVFDISDPGSIRQIGQFNPDGYAEDITIVGDTALVAFFDKGLYALDISQPERPRAIGSVPIPGNARSVTVKDGYAYVAGWESGVQIVDISDLSKLQIVGYYDTSGSAWGLDISGDYAYVWDWWGGVKVVEIGDPAAPRLVGQYQARNPVNRLAIRDNYLYTASGAGGLQVYDINNALNPIWATGLDLAGEVQDVAIAGDYAYLATAQGIVAVDVKNPFYAHWHSRLRTPGTVERVVAQHGYLIAVDAQAGLLLVDARAPQSLAIVDQVAQPVNDIFAYEQRLYLATGTRLQAYNWSGSHLKKTAEFAGEWSFTSVRAQQEFVYAVEQRAIAQGSHDKRAREPSSVLHVFKLNADDLKSVARYPLPAQITDLHIQDDVLFTYGPNIGLLQFDLHSPQHLRLTARYPATGNSTHFVTNGAAAFFNGEKSVTSVSLLQDLQWEKTSVGWRIQFSETTPLGRYALSALTHSGDVQVMPDLLRVHLPKPKKPKFTMEDFKRILKQRQQQNPSGDTASP